MKSVHSTHNYWCLNLNELRQSVSSFEISYFNSLGFTHINVKLILKYTITDMIDMIKFLLQYKKIK